MKKINKKKPKVLKVEKFEKEAMACSPKSMSSCKGLPCYQGPAPAKWDNS